MKKTLTVLLVWAIAISIVFAGGAAETTTNNTVSESEAAVFADVEPLDEKVHLTISITKLYNFLFYKTKILSKFSIF